MLFVVNENRLMVSKPEDALEMMGNIEKASHLKISGIVNNTHLMGLTTPETIRESVSYAEGISKLAGVPLLFVAYPKAIGTLTLKNIHAYPIDIYVKNTWDEP
jgi:hypothetical protein